MAKPSIYDPVTYQAIRSRLVSLEAGNSRKWGKMDAPQMLTHLRKALETGLRNTGAKQGLVGLLLGPFIKKMVLSDQPYKQGLPTGKQVIVSDQRNFDSEKTKLLEALDLFVQNGGSYAAQIVHPMFGKMTAEEWGYSQWKHFDHHLRQFSA